MNSITKRIHPFVELGKLLHTNIREEIAYRAHSTNPWFTTSAVEGALLAIAQQYLDEKKLTQWITQYPNLPLEDIDIPQKVGVVMAGNIPAVGFHDLLAVLISGHHLLAKLSTDDRTLMLFIIQKLIDIEPTLASRISVVERLNDADAFIATGSDNTARYFEYYFSKKPHLIRRNRTSLGILNGTESAEELLALATDVLLYFGLGCRNVSKVLVPAGYDFIPFLTLVETHFEEYRHHYKYFHNYEYNKSIYLINGDAHLDNGFLIVKESEGLVSPISVLFFEEYKSQNHLSELVDLHRPKLQCIVSQGGSVEGSLPFGQAQAPSLFDYADGIDTMAFLTNL